MMKVYCSSCARQAVSGATDPFDEHITTRIGAVADVGGTCICGHCAKDLDENGMFPEERAMRKRGERNEH
jgi:hypothetical protein